MRVNLMINPYSDSQTKRKAIKKGKTLLCFCCLSTYDILLEDPVTPTGGSGIHCNSCNGVLYSNLTPATAELCRLGQHIMQFIKIVRL